MNTIIKELVPAEPQAAAAQPTAADAEQPAHGDPAPSPVPADAAVTPARIKAAFSAVEERVVRELILDGKRPDGRGPKDLRSIKCEVGLLPRAHGSAVFQRGETQALVTTVLGTGADEQRVDGIMDEYSKKFMLDYNMPSFAVGEVRPIRGPGRREIGHGALAERSVAPILPGPSQFPYTIRVVSDILESNGSSSMASVCGATLSLMDAGVPISDPVGGISIGLVQDEATGRHILLTDIIGDEDHFGDMDFKVAGTQRGVTGIQLDLKNHGITEEIIRETLEQAREARLEILRAMLRAIKRPREEISANAPRLIQIQINPEKIGMVIGPGGKTIRRLQEETGAKIDIDDTGVVTLSSLEAAGAEAARDKIVAMTEGVQVGRIYEGRVTSIKEFGAFVEILPGKDGLVHISELSDGYVSSVTDVCRVGDPMLVKAIAVDDQDRVKLSRKAALAERGQVDELAGRTRPPARRAVAATGAARAVADRGGPAAADRRRGVPAGRRRRRRDRAMAAATAETGAVRGGPDDGRSRPDRCVVVRRTWLGAVRVEPGDSSRVARRTRPPATGEISHGKTPCPARSRIPGSKPGPSRAPPSESPARRRCRHGVGGSPPAGGLAPALPTADEEPEITRRLRAQYAEISQLAGGLAHEIRNPLSTLSLNLDLLPRTFRTPRPRATAGCCSGSNGCSTRSTGCTISSRASCGSPGCRT